MWGDSGSLITGSFRYVTISIPIFYNPTGRIELEDMNLRVYRHLSIP